MATSKRRALHKGRRRGYKLSPQARANMSAARRGKRHPHRGHPNSPATRAKISAALKGKHHKGHPMSPATRAKISAKLKGRHRKGASTSRPGGGKAGGGRRVAHQVRRRSTAPRIGASRVRFRVSYQRVKVGARRGFFRHETRVSARRKRFMSNNGVLRKHGFFRKNRKR